MNEWLAKNPQLKMAVSADVLHNPRNRQDCVPNSVSLPGTRCLRRGFNLACRGSQSKARVMTIKNRRANDDGTTGAHLYGAWRHGLAVPHFRVVSVIVLRLKRRWLSILLQRL